MTRSGMSGRGQMLSVAIQYRAVGHIRPAVAPPFGEGLEDDEEGWYEEDGEQC